MKQLSLIPHSLSFGGSLLKHKQKQRRPLKTNTPIHLVLKSEQIIKHDSFKNHQELLHKLKHELANKYSITIYDWVICSNHIHAIVKFTDLANFQNFLRSYTAKVAIHLGKEKSFWSHRPFTRVLHWGRDFHQTMNYLEKNKLETEGWIYFKSRE